MEILLVKNAPRETDQVLVDGEPTDISLKKDRELKREIDQLIVVLESAKNEYNMLLDGCTLFFPEGPLRKYGWQGANKLRDWIVFRKQFDGFCFERKHGKSEAILRLPAGLNLGIVEYGTYATHKAHGITGIKDNLSIFKYTIDERILPLINEEKISVITMVNQMLDDKRDRLFVLSGKIGSGKTYAIHYAAEQLKNRDDCLLLPVNAELALGKEIDETLMKLFKDVYGGNVSPNQFEKALYGDEKLKNIIIFFDQMQNLIQEERNELVNSVTKWIGEREIAKAVFATREQYNIKDILIEKGSIDVRVFTINDLNESVFTDAGVSRDDLANIKILTPLMYSILINQNNKSTYSPKIDTVFDALDYYYKKMETSARRRNIGRLISEVAPRIAYYMREFSNVEGFTESEINRQIINTEGIRAERISTVMLNELSDAGVLITERKRDKTDKKYKYAFFYEPFRDYLAARHVMNFIRYIEEEEIRCAELDAELNPIIEATEYDKGNGKEVFLQYATFLFLEAINMGVNNWCDREKMLLLRLGTNIGFEDTTIWNSLYVLLEWFSNNESMVSKVDYRLAVTINGALYEKISSDKITLELYTEKQKTLNSIKKLYYGLFPYLVRDEECTYEGIEGIADAAIANSPFKGKYDYMGKVYGNLGALFEEHLKLYLCKAENSTSEKDDKLYEDCINALKMAEINHYISFVIKTKYNCSGQIRSRISSASDKYYMARVMSIYDRKEEAKTLYENACNSYDEALSMHTRNNLSGIQQAEEKWVILWRWAGCYRELYKLTTIKAQKDEYLEKMISKQREAINNLIDAVDDNRFAQYRNRKYIKQFVEDIIDSGRNGSYRDEAKGDLERFAKAGVHYEKLRYVEDLINLHNSCGFYALIQTDIVEKAMENN